MRNGFLECVAKRIVLGAFVAAAVVCGGSKHPQTMPTSLQGEGAAFVRAALPVGAIALNRPNEEVAQEDIARGYRLAAEATEEMSYAMPPNATLVGNWHRRGTFGEWLRYELGWTFPLGSNDTSYSAFSVFNDGKIRPTPRDRSHEICAVGVPMLTVQGESRFWVCDGSGGETVLTWEHFYLNADTNAPINAQIVLCENGDFVTRSNEVARYYTRIDPNDWDGDGLANEIDDAPYTNNGDCFGTGDEWRRRSYEAWELEEDATGRVAWSEAALRQGAYVLTIAVEVAGASLLEVGGKRIILRESGTAEVLVPPGRVVEIRCGGRIAAVAASAADAAVRRIDDALWEAERAVAVSVSGDGALASQAFATVEAAVAPTVDGGVEWAAGGDAELAAAEGSRADVVWGGAVGASVCGWVRSVFTNRYVAVTNEVWRQWHREAEGPDLAPTNAYLSVAVDGLPDAVVLTHNAYENAPQELHPMASSEAEVVCRYNGSAAGTLRLADNGGDADCFDVRAVASDGSLVDETLPRQWSVTGADTQRFRIRANRVEDGRTARLQLTFTPQRAPARASREATVRTVEVETTADCLWPENRRRHVFGPREGVTFRVSQGTAAWAFPHFGCVRAGAAVQTNATDGAGAWSVVVSNRNAGLTLDFRTIVPNYFPDFSEWRYAYENSDWTTNGLERMPVEGELGCAFVCWPRLKPYYVSFQKLCTKEGAVDATEVTGFFEELPDYLLRHGERAGGDAEAAVREGNYIGRDFVGGTVGGRCLGQEGGFVWDIPNGWYLPGSSVTNKIHWSRMALKVFSNGVVRVSKFGIAVERSTNNVYRTVWAPPDDAP